ncbi:hypothetical protein CTA1_10776 [Colletotrichum tanaceti]|uniref:Uncharacterized protein n=1 Tax=Colletotrichum tanaceti TaxID=1306861 RepID=A0A4U6XF34_9PEZI|nr:hypothetical protein CTA1_10776 [Colletotrichum tanaceti]
MRATLGVRGGPTTASRCRKEYGAGRVSVRMTGIWDSASSRATCVVVPVSWTSPCRNFLHFSAGCSFYQWRLGTALNDDVHVGEILFDVDDLLNVPLGPRQHPLRVSRPLREHLDRPRRVTGHNGLATHVVVGVDDERQLAGSDLAKGRLVVLPFAVGEHLAQLLDGGADGAHAGMFGLVVDGDVERDLGAEDAAVEEGAVSAGEDADADAVDEAALLAAERGRDGAGDAAEARAREGLTLQLDAVLCKVEVLRVAAVLVGVREAVAGGVLRRDLDHTERGRQRRQAREDVAVGQVERGDVGLCRRDPGGRRRAVLGRAETGDRPVADDEGEVPAGDVAEDGGHLGVALEEGVGDAVDDEAGPRLLGPFGLAAEGGPLVGRGLCSHLGRRGSGVLGRRLVEGRAHALPDDVVIQLRVAVDVDLQRGRADGQRVGVPDDQVGVVARAGVAHAIPQVDGVGGDGRDGLQGLVLRQVERVANAGLEHDVLGVGPFFVERKLIYRSFSQQRLTNCQIRNKRSLLAGGPVVRLVGNGDAVLVEDAAGGQAGGVGLELVQAELGKGGDGDVSVAMMGVSRGGRPASRPADGSRTEEGFLDSLAVRLEHLGDLPGLEGMVEGADADAVLPGDAQHGLKVLGEVAVVVHGDAAAQHGDGGLELQVGGKVAVVPDEAPLQVVVVVVVGPGRGEAGEGVAVVVLLLQVRLGSGELVAQDEGVGHAGVAVDALGVLAAGQLHVAVAGVGRDVVLEQQLLDDVLAQLAGPEDVLDDGALAAHDVGGARQDERGGDAAGHDDAGGVVVRLHGVEDAQEGGQRAVGLAHLVLVAGDGQCRPQAGRVVRVHVDQAGRHEAAVQVVFVFVLGGVRPPGPDGPRGRRRELRDEAPVEPDVHGLGGDGLSVEQGRVAQHDRPGLATGRVPSRVGLAGSRLGVLGERPGGGAVLDGVSEAIQVGGSRGGRVPGGGGGGDVAERGRLSHEEKRGPGEEGGEEDAHEHAR